MKASKPYIVIALIVNMSIANAADDVSNSGKISGLLQTMYIDKRYTNPVSDSSAFSAAGKLKYESGEWNGLKAAIAAYASDVVLYKDYAKPNDTFNDVEGKPFLYLGEGYADYRFDDGSICAGRQLMDTPLIVSSDIRRLPDTFEAATAIYNGIENTALFAGYVHRWTGYDSGYNISQFKRPAADSKGAVILGITHDGIENLAVQGWFYSLAKMANAMYVQSDYTIPLSDETELGLSAQVSHFSEDMDSNQIATGIDGTLYGIQTSLTAGMATLRAAYNHVSNKEGKFIINGLGNGPYYTSREEWSLDGMEDGRAYCGSVDVNMAQAGMEALTLSAVYEVFSSVPANAEIQEREFIATYKKNDVWHTEISYVMVNDRNNNAGSGGADADYCRFLTRIKFLF